MTTLVCNECRHENEPERIYCHNCGARLDRSVLPTNQASGEEKPEETHRRLKRMLQPRGPRAVHSAKNFAKLVLGAMLLAFIIQLLREPDLPASPNKSNSVSRPINMELDTAIREHHPSEISYSEQTVNSYLAYTLRQNRGQGFPLAFVRFVAAFDEGLCRVTTERTLFGFPIYCSTVYSVALVEGNIVGMVHGGSIGRVPLSPKIVKYVDAYLHPWSLLERERKIVARFGSIQFRPGSVTLLLKTQ